MKTLLSILASVLFFSVCFVPSDDAPLSAFVLWFAWSGAALWGVHRIFRLTEKWDKEDEQK